MKNVKATVFASLIPLSLLALSGCGEQEASKTESEVETKMEQAEQKAKETMDTAKEKSEDAWDETKEKSEEAWDETKDKSEDAWQKTKEKAQDAGDYAGDKAGKAGDYIDDSVITTRVKAVIFEDDNLNSMNISVETNDGTVKLSGSVESEADIDTAENLASSVEGVEDIENNLQVK